MEIKKHIKNKLKGLENESHISFSTASSGRNKAGSI